MCQENYYCDIIIRIFYCYSDTKQFKSQLTLLATVHTYTHILFCEKNNCSQSYNDDNLTYFDKKKKKLDACAECHIPSDAITCFTFHLVMPVWQTNDGHPRQHEKITRTL